MLPLSPPGASWTIRYWTRTPSPSRSTLRKNWYRHTSKAVLLSPVVVFLDNTNEALAGILRTGRAGSNTATDHISVLDQALSQLPRHTGDGGVGRCLVRTDGAESSHAFLEHLVAQNLDSSVGYAVTDEVRAAIGMLPGWAWTIAMNADGGRREGAAAKEHRCLRPPTSWPKPTGFGGPNVAARASAGKTSQASRTAWPEGVRISFRRERLPSRSPTQRLRRTRRLVLPSLRH